MADKILKTIIQLRRDTQANWAAIEESFTPRKGEVCLIDTTDKGLRVKVGDGLTLLKSLPYADDVIYEEIDKVVLVGYFLNGKFYTDSTYQVELQKSINKVYIDKSTNVVYHYNGANYISVNDTLPNASDTVAGIMKLYQASGENTDGAMSQAVVTNGVKDIKFGIDSRDTECLTLELPW